MDRQRILADLLRRTADAIDQGTCILTNAQASMIIAGDGSWQIQARAEIRRVSELLAMAINGRRAKSPNTIVWLPLHLMNL